jgi:hypothetical protein
MLRMDKKTSKEDRMKRVEQVINDVTKQQIFINMILRLFLI